MSEADDKLKKLDGDRRALMAEFRRRLSRILNQEAEVLGLLQQDHYEIEIYY